MAVAIEDYIRSTPECRHVVAAWQRPEDVGNDLGRLAEWVPLPSGMVRQWRFVRRLIADRAPDIVHAHSSLAGLYARLGWATSSYPVIYSPHCYAFERRDIGLVRRATYETVERVLARRTALTMAVSPHEAAIARRLNPQSAVAYVPNVARLEPSSVTLPRPRKRLRIAALGRLCPQKNPDFFAEVIRRIDPTKRSAIHWVWIGGGASHYERNLRECGATVTGWCDRHTAMRVLRSCHVYLHTASWEGAPVALIEAATLGLPIVAKDIPALRSLAVPQLFTNPEDVACYVVSLLNKEEFAHASQASRLLASNHNPTAQSTKLLQAYRGVLGHFGRHHADISLGTSSRSSCVQRPQ